MCQHKIPKHVRSVVIREFGQNCYICGEFQDIDSLTLDHVIPYRIRKMHEVENLRPCCKKCNNLKGSMTLESFQRRVLVDLVIEGLTSGRTVLE